MEIFYDSNVVVALSFFLFFGLLAYLGVHKFVLGALDKRADGIRNELDEARRLREEAQELFAEFERKQREVEGQAEDIIANAKAEAEAAAERAKADLATSIERRLKAADEQIALAESNAVKEVKDTAVSVAIAAASEVLTAKLGADQAEGLVDAAIKDVGAKLH
ncbi:MAG: ATP F0F1 synthase subunit B [Pseudomonadota bacterium]